jgi:uncharacterized membrane protein
MDKRSGISGSGMGSAYGSKPSGSNQMAGRSSGNRQAHGASGGGILDKLGFVGTQNVSETERLVTGIGGAVLALSGLRRGGISGLLRIAAGGALLARASTGHCPMYESMGDDQQEQRLARQHGWEHAAVTRESIIINRPREQLFAFWRDFSNLSKVMTHVERVDVIDSRRSRWLMQLPLGKELQWNSTVTEERQNERIAWSADDNADVRNSGWVEFRDAGGGRGTEVIVQLAYEPPGGEIGNVLAKLWPQSPGALLKRDLKEFKEKVESGRIEMQAGSASSRLGSSGLSGSSTLGGGASGSTPQRH